MSPASNARFAVTYNDKRETLEDFATCSRGYAMRNRCGVQLLTALSLLFISVICLSRAGELCCYTTRGRERLFNNHAGLLWNPAEKLDTDPGQTKSHCISPWRIALGWKKDEWEKTQKAHRWDSAVWKFVSFPEAAQNQEDIQHMEKVPWESNWQAYTPSTRRWKQTVDHKEFSSTEYPCLPALRDLIFPIKKIPKWCPEVSKGLWPNAFFKR